MMLASMAVRKQFHNLSVAKISIFFQLLLVSPVKSDEINT